MLEPGYDIERACKARLGALFQRAMPGPAPPADPASGVPGIEHHDARRASVFGRLDDIGCELQAASAPPPRSGLKATGLGKEKPCDSQAVFFKPSSSEGGGQGEVVRGKGKGSGKGSGGKGGGRSGFVRYDLNVQVAQQQVEAPGAVLGFLNTLRERHGKRQLDDASDAERCASLGAPRKRRPPSAATTTISIKVAAKAGERAAPKAGLALGGPDDQDDDADGRAEAAAAAVASAASKPVAAAAASVVVFRRVAPGSKAKKQMRRRAADEDDSGAETPASSAALSGRP